MGTMHTRDPSRWQQLVPVRLAHMVVQRYLRDAEFVAAYWIAASTRYTDDASCHLPLRHIRGRLERQRYLAATSTG